MQYIEYLKLVEKGDELRRNLTRFYPGFVEDVITFPPTYKFSLESSEREDMIYSQKRLPGFRYF